MSKVDNGSDGDKVIKLARYVISLFRLILNVKVEVSGTENIPRNSSVLFLANHFTRFETILVPHVINSMDGMKFCRSLADRDLFVGKMDGYLKKLKTLSTGDPERDGIIMGDLVDGSHNWLIYPEGKMVKDKNVFTSDNVNSETVSAKTGSAVLALKVAIEFMRHAGCNTNGLYICPISISYNAIRPRQNRLQSVIHRFIGKKLSPRISEELFVESSLILHSRVLINFDKPIGVRDFIASKYGIISKIPFLSDEKRDDMLIKSLRYPLTHKVMSAIYGNISIGIDHVMSLAIYCILKNNKRTESMRYFMDLVFAILSMIRLDNPCVKSLENVGYWESIDLLCECGAMPAFNEAIKYFTDSDLIKIADDCIEFNSDKLTREYDIHLIRSENICRVLFNEISYFVNVVKKAEEYVRLDWRALNLVISDHLIALENNVFESEYHRYYVYGESKNRHICSPRLYKATNGSAEIGVVLSHGYKSAPAEVEEIAKYLSGKGMNVYCLRLKGHGTTAFDMKKTTHLDWMKSFRVGYEIVSRRYNKVFISGFSTGGLLALVHSSHSDVGRKIYGTICINAALRISDIRFKFVRFAKLWSDVLGKFSENAKEYIESEPENPHINYRKNYFSCMRELQILMGECNEVLPNITAPTFVIQSALDPVVSPSSGMGIYSKIGSISKEIYEPSISRHVIILGEQSMEVFKKIENFINRQVERR